MKAKVFLEPDQVSLAIGKGGTNIKLASKLTGFEIDVFRNTPNEVEIDDVELDEFSDEIDSLVIDSLKNIGCDAIMESVARMALGKRYKKTLFGSFKQPAPVGKVKHGASKLEDAT